MARASDSGPRNTKQKKQITPEVLDRADKYHALGTMRGVTKQQRSQFRFQDGEGDKDTQRLLDAARTIREQRSAPWPYTPPRTESKRVNMAPPTTPKIGQKTLPAPTVAKGNTRGTTKTIGKAAAPGQIKKVTGAKKATGKRFGGPKEM